MKVDMIITNSETGNYEEEYCDFVKLINVDVDDMMLIMKYAFNSGYDVGFKKSEEDE